MTFKKTTQIGDPPGLRLCRMLALLAFVGPFFFWKHKNNKKRFFRKKIIWLANKKIWPFFFIYNQKKTEKTWLRPNFFGQLHNFYGTIFYLNNVYFIVRLICKLDISNARRNEQANRKKWLANRIFWPFFFRFFIKKVRFFWPASQKFWPFSDGPIRPGFFLGQHPA